MTAPVFPSIAKYPGGTVQPDRRTSAPARRGSASSSSIAPRIGRRTAAPRAMPADLGSDVAVLRGPFRDLARAAGSEARAIFTLYSSRNSLPEPASIAWTYSASFATARLRNTCVDSGTTVSASAGAKGRGSLSDHRRIR